MPGVVLLGAARSVHIKCRALCPEEGRRHGPVRSQRGRTRHLPRTEAAEVAVAMSLPAGSERLLPTRKRVINTRGIERGRKRVSGIRGDPYAFSTIPYQGHTIGRRLRSRKLVPLKEVGPCTGLASIRAPQSRADRRLSSCVPGALQEWQPESDPTRMARGSNDQLRDRADRTGYTVRVAPRPPLRRPSPCLRKSDRVRRMDRVWLTLSS